MNIRNGDVFRWYYKDDKEYRSKCPNGTAYWCMDNQCYATERSGTIYLVDTYWSDYGSEYIGNEVKLVDVDKVDLEFVCNLYEIEFIADYYVQDYDKVYNLSRQKGCHKRYAKDTGAEFSNEALKKKYISEYNHLHSEKEYAERRMLWLSDKIDELEALK